MKSLQLLLLVPEVDLSLFLEHASFVLQHWHICVMSKSFSAMAACHWLTDMMHHVKHLPDNGPVLPFDMMYHATVSCLKASDRNCGSI